MMIINVLKIIYTDIMYKQLLQATRCIEQNFVLMYNPCHGVYGTKSYKDV